MIELLLLPVIVGWIVALVAAPLGAFVVWNRLVYFGDTLAHSALLGVSLSFMIAISPTLGILFSSIVVAIVLWFMQSRSGLANDSLLGIISHSALALGLVSISFLSDQRIDLYSYLFGDLLTVTLVDLFVIGLTGVLIVTTLIIFWRKLLMITVDQNLAKVEGIAVDKIRLLLMLLIALLIGLAMKVVGILLITALLIIPASTARRISGSPEAMIVIAALLASASVFAGLTTSYFFNTPPGASIVLSNTVFFIFSHLLKKRH